MAANLTWPQWNALYAAATVLLDITGSRELPWAMRRLAGERWRVLLRRARAELSGELACHRYLRGKQPSPSRPVKLRARAALISLAAMHSDEARLSFLTRLMGG